MNPVYKLLFLILILLPTHVFSQTQCFELLETQNPKRYLNQKIYKSYRGTLEDLSFEEVQLEFKSLLGRNKAKFKFEKLMAVIDRLSDDKFFERVKPIFNQIKISERMPRTQREYRIKGEWPYIRIKRTKKNRALKMKPGRTIKVPSMFPESDTELSLLIFNLMKGLNTNALLSSTLPGKPHPSADFVLGPEGYTNWQKDLFVSGYMDTFSVFEKLQLKFPDVGTFSSRQDRLNRSIYWDYLFAFAPSFTFKKFLGFLPRPSIFFNYRPQRRFGPRGNDFEAYQEDSSLLRFQLENRFGPRFSLQWKSDYLKRTALALILAKTIAVAWQADIPIISSLQTIHEYYTVVADSLAQSELEGASTEE